MARILGSHPRGPGSIPGMGEPLFDNHLKTWMFPRYLSARLKLWSEYDLLALLKSSTEQPQSIVQFLELKNGWSKSGSPTPGIEPGPLG